MYLSRDLENIQRRAMRIIYPTESYEDGLLSAGLSSLFLRRQQITNKVFLNDDTHKLHQLLLAKNNTVIILGKNQDFLFNTNHFKSSFVTSRSIGHNSQ